MNAFRHRVASFLAGLDPHFAQVLSGSAIAFVLRVFGAGLAFALNVAIGRLLGAEGAGLYFLALSVVTIGAVITKLGLDNALLRHIATGMAKGDADSVVGVFRMGMRSASIASLTAVATVFAFAPWIAEQIVDDSRLTPILRAMSMGIFTFAIMTLLAECLKGLNRIRDSMVVSGVLYPAIALGVLWPLIASQGASGAAMAYVLATGVAALVGWALWRKNTRGMSASAPTFERKVLQRSSRPLWVMSIINRGILPWAPLFLLGAWGTTEDAGVFGATTRVAMLVTFFLTAVNTVIAPKFAELYANDEIEALGRLARKFAALITLAASPLLLLLMFAGEWVMSLFGSEFKQGGTALAILALGQAVNTLTGSAGTLLMMTGYEREIRNSSIIAGAITISVSIVLIPDFGIVGAAIATSVSIAAVNLISVAVIKKKLGLGVLPSVKI